MTRLSSELEIIPLGLSYLCARGHFALCWSWRVARYAGKRHIAMIQFYGCWPKVHGSIRRNVDA